MGLAVHNFHDTYNHLPSSIRPGGLTTAPRIAGLTFVLPFIEQGTIFDKYDQSVNWSHANNLPYTSMPIKSFQCPSAPDPKRFDGDPQLSPWSQIVAVTDYSPTIGVDQHPYYGTEGTAEAYAFHPGGAMFGLGDGSVRFIASTINMREFARLVTRDQGEAQPVP